MKSGVNQSLGAVGAVGYFKTMIDSPDCGVPQNYVKAVGALKAYSPDVCFSDFTVDFLYRWLTYLFENGYSYKVARYYLVAIAAMYNKEVKCGRLEANAAFKVVKKKLAEIEGLDFDFSAREDAFVKFRTLARYSIKPGEKMSVFADMVLVGVLSGGMRPEDVARLRKDDISRFCPEISEILQRQSAPGRQFVFDLEQSYRTDRQLARYVNDGVSDLLRLRGIPRQPSLKDTFVNLWAFAALQCGYSPEVVAGCLGCRPAGNPVFALCDIADVSDAEKAGVVQTVARTMLTNPRQWFVMHIRSGASYDEIIRRIAAYETEIVKPEIFYPCDEIAKKVGRKLIYRNRPIIPDIVFFRCRRTDVTPLFRYIGDLAWCYTTTGVAHGEYAIVPKAAMETFQRTIGRFTPDYEIYPLGTLTPKEGDKVVIVGGWFIGNEAVIEKVKSDNMSSDTIYQVKFPDEQGIEWRVNVDSRLVKGA